MVNHYNETSYYGNLDPKIYYGDGWFYGAVLPKTSVAIPSNVYVIHEKNYNIISWNNPGKSDVKEYWIYRSKTYGHADETMIAVINSVGLDGKIQTCYIDYLTENEEDIQYYYAVVAVDQTNYFSLHSDWAADINMDQPYQHYKYLYTDQMTQTYWNTLDLMDKLGNFDTDRNIVPFRDLGNDYIQKLDEQGDTVNVPVKKDCNYLYATLLTLTDEQKEYYSNNDLKYGLYLDETLFAENTPQTLTSVNIVKTDSKNKVIDLKLSKETFLDAIEADINDENSLDLEYISNIDLSGAKGLKSFSFDPEKFFNKVLSTQVGDTIDLPKTGITFQYIAVDKWMVTGWVFNHTVIVYNDLDDYGISYSKKTSKLVSGVGGTRFTINEYWVEKGITSDTIITSTLERNKDIVTLSTPENVFYGITYNYVIPDNNTLLHIDYSKKAFIYFRVPYIYDSKLLQTYIIDNISGKKINNITFKTYNYLIFPSTLGKIFNQKQIELKETRGNLYKTDAASSAIYQNFGSFFGFEQPAWLDDTRYRRCVLGNDSTPGLIDSGIHGGTFRGIKEAVNALSQGEAELTDQSTTEYLEVYTDYSTEYSVKPIINLYNPSQTYNVGNIIAYNPILESSSSSDSQNTQYILEINSIIPSDSSVTFYGNGTANENSITIKSGNTSLNTVISDTDFLVEGCTVSDDREDPDVTYTYIKCVASGTPKSFELNGQYFVNVDSEYKNLVIGITIGNKVDLYKLTGSHWHLINSIPAVSQTQWIFRSASEIAKESWSTDPVSYTHNYILNTWNLTYSSWKQTILNEKYIVYGNTIKLNNDYLIDGSMVYIKNIDTNTDYIMAIDFSVDYKTGYITWVDSNTKPKDGTYVTIQYDIDIRREIIRLINLIKYPQVNINYIWSTEVQNG